jgi:hypothetical protein
VLLFELALDLAWFEPIDELDDEFEETEEADELWACFVSTKFEGVLV